MHSKWGPSSCNVTRKAIKACPGRSGGPLSHLERGHESLFPPRTSVVHVNLFVVATTHPTGQGLHHVALLHFMYGTNPGCNNIIREASSRKSFKRCSTSQLTLCTQKKFSQLLGHIFWDHLEQWNVDSTHKFAYLYAEFARKATSAKLSWALSLELPRRARTTVNTSYATSVSGKLQRLWDLLSPLNDEVCFRWITKAYSIMRIYNVRTRITTWTRWIEIKAQYCFDYSN